MTRAPAPWRGAALLVLATATAAPGQTGTTPLVLRLQPGPRALALGDAYVAGAGSEALFSNPARITVQPGTGVAAGRYGSTATLAALASTLSMGHGWTVGVGARYLDYDAQGPRPGEPGDLTTRGPLPATSLAAGVAVARPLLGFQAGLMVQYVAEHRPDRVAEGVAWDAGVSRDLGRFTLGLAAQNLGGRLVVGAAARDLPERVTLGAAWRLPPVGPYLDVTPVAAITVDRSGTARPGGGVNVAYVPVEGWEFALRVGARRAERTGVERPFPGTVGLGFALDRVALDYAFESFSGAGAAHRLGVRVR